MFRYVFDKPFGNRPNVKTAYPLDAKVKQMLGALTFSSLCIYVRCVVPPVSTLAGLTPDSRSWYRTVELANGWQGYIIHTQRYFGTSCLELDRWIPNLNVVYMQSSWMPS